MACGKITRYVARMPTRNIPAAPVARNLKRALAEKQMTQEALAREAGVGLRIVQDWCNGRVLPRWPRLVTVACVLGRDPGWFYGNHDDQPDA